MNSDSKLKKLGVADAKGIASYFGLSKAGIRLDAEFHKMLSGEVYQFLASELLETNACSISTPGKPFFIEELITASVSFALVPLFLSPNETNSPCIFCASAAPSLLVFGLYTSAPFGLELSLEFR